MKIPKSWQEYIANHWSAAQHADLLQKVAAEFRESQIYPPETKVFRAFELCPVQKLKAVILGQDPYHGPYQADGLAFSVSSGVKLPPSLRNIYKEIIRDFGDLSDSRGNLSAWAEQGVLLLNSSLTVRAGEAGSHAHLGWQDFSDAVIQSISEQADAVVFFLWGNHARQKTTLIDSRKHLILESVHPSPLSAHRGFIGCGHFSACNSYLENKQIDPIKW